MSTAKPRANPRLTKPVLDILLIYEKFSGEKRFEKMSSHALNIEFSDYFIAKQEFQIFSAKSIMMVKVFKYLTKSQLVVKFLPETEVAVYRCSIKKLSQRV